MTDPEYENWLADTSATRVVLCELDYAGGTRYVANFPFISLPTDTHPNRIYDDLLQEAVDIDTRIDGLVGFGELTLIDDGELLSWSSDAWRGHGIRIYLGGPDWPLDDYRLHAVGINGGIMSASRGEITFEMVDQSALLDDVIDTGELPADAGPIPLALGSVFNAPAYLLTPSPYEFKASFLPCTALSPKDNGNPVGHTDNLPNGSFVLSAPVSGTLTVDIEEQHNTPALIAQWVADHYGITVADIDMPAYTVGLYYNNEVTGREILDELCDGLGAYWYLDQLGGLVVRQRSVPTEPEITLFEDDINRDQIALSQTQPPWSSLTLRFGRNYEPLSSVAGVIDPELAAILQREWSEVRGTQSLPDYPLAEQMVRDTCISSATDAATERDRLLLQRSVRRDIYTIEAFMPIVEVAQAIEVDHPRMAGKIGSVISVSRSPTSGTTEIGVWV
ncbi:hypothetical protein LG331_09975 [Vreelandella aquamarina]|uniref:hypothetical protein n=1 Tax=Vreelandella aquamarina TaxID=77097 RepID=UPI00384B475B